MGIDISKLTGVLQDLANTADIDKNGKIEGKEETIFDNYAKTAIQNGQVEETDYKEIFGSTIKTTSTTAPTPNTDTKKDIERKADYVLRSLESAITENPNDILATLNRKIGTLANDATYKNLMDDVKNILTAIQTTKYDSKEGIEKLEKKIKKDLDISRKDHFEKDVLDLLVKNAEADQKSKEYEKVEASYKQKVKSGSDEEDAFKEVKKEFKKDGSYYKEVLKTLEKNIMTDQRQVVMDAVLDSEATKSKKVKKDAKATLKENDDWNKYTKKALKGERTFTEKMNGENSDMKNLRKTQATKNKVEKIKTTPQSKETILKALGKKHREVFEALVASGLILKQENGLYDLTPLSDLIGDYVGADFTLNRQSKAFKAIAEKTKTTSGLAVATQLETLDEGEAKDLVKLCGYKVEGLNIAKGILGATVGAIATGLGGIAGSANDTTVYAKSQAEVNINCDLDVAAKLKDNMEKQEGVAAHIVSSGIQIIVDQKSIVPVLWYTTDKIVAAALRGAVIGAVAGFATGLSKGEEQPIASIEIEKCKDIEAFQNSIDNEVHNKKVTPKYGVILKELAKVFYKNGEWDKKGFSDFLQDSAGAGGILNRKELIAALADLKNQKVENNTVDNTIPQKTPQDQEQEHTQPLPQEETCNAIVDKNNKDTTFVHNRKGGDTWKGIIEAYYPELADKYGLWGNDGAIRKLKEALSYNEDGTFNKETYTKLLNGGDLPKEMLLPAEIDGVKRVDTGKVKAQRVQGNGQALVDKVGNRSGETTYIAKDGCDESITATGKTKEEAVKALEEKTGRDYPETLENYEN